MKRITFAYIAFGLMAISLAGYSPLTPVELKFSDVYDQIEHDRADPTWYQDDFQYCLDNTRGTEEECERWAIKTATEDARERAMESE